MDVEVAASRDDAGQELDLMAYPAERGPSLLEVAAAGIADRLAGARSLADLPQLPVVGMVTIGLAVGAGLGMALFAS